MLSEIISRIRKHLRDKRWKRQSEERILEYLDKHEEVDVLVFSGKDKIRMFGYVAPRMIRAIDIFDGPHGPVICTIAQWARRGVVTALTENHDWVRYTALGRILGLNPRLSTKSTVRRGV